MTFAEMEPDDQKTLLNSFSDLELKELLDEMYVDDAADLVEEMPANVVKRILKQIDPQMRRTINQILRYPEDSAGSVMTTEYVSLRPDQLRLSDLGQVIWKEIRTAVLCGLALGVVCFVKIWLVDKLLLGNEEITLMVDLVVCLSLFVTVVAAKLVGAALPLLAKALGLDPAVMASPFITSIVDALSLLVYFFFARSLLGI